MATKNRRPGKGDGFDCQLGGDHLKPTEIAAKTQDDAPRIVIDHGGPRIGVVIQPRRIDRLSRWFRTIDQARDHAASLGEAEGWPVVDQGDTR